MSRSRARVRLWFWLAMVVLLCVAALVAPHVLAHDPIRTDLMSVNQPPSAAYPLGTDAVGRCVACRVLAGVHTSLFAALAVVLAASVVGTAAGTLAGYIGGVLDAIVMRLADAFMAFPSLVLSIAVAGLLGGGLANAVVALALTDWARYARLARSQVLSVRSRTFVEAEVAGGVHPVRIALVHVLPNMAPPLVCMACLDVGGMVLNLAGLSFLGLGANPPSPELGSMVNQAAATFQIAPWAVFAPGVAILLIVMVLNMFGDAVNDLLSADGEGTPATRGVRARLRRRTR